MSAITAKASRKMKKYAVLTREPRCFLGSFDFSWEQRKFGEITSKYEDPVPTPHDGYYRLGIRSHAKGTFHSYVAKGQELETAQMHRVAAGNFIVNITFGWEHAVAITDKNDAGKLVSHRFPQFSFAEGMVPEFFRYVIVDEKFRHHLWLASPGGAGRNRVLKLDEMLNYLMRFPSRDEQIKIAEFFRHLDNLITLHQRKCANLCSPSQVVFSLLFATSTFSWEQRKLGDIASDMVAGGDIDKDLILAEGQYPVIANALTGDGIVGYYDKEYRVNAPAVTVTGRGDVGHAKARLVNFTPVVRLLSVKSEHDVFFLENAINTLKIVIESTGVPQLTVPQLAKYEVAFPRQLDEEEHIGAFFKQLDHLITLHQRECISFTGRADRLILTANKKRTTSSWEQRKLSEITDKVTEKNAGLQYVETFTNSAEFGIISQRDFFDHDIAKLGSLDGYYIVKNEDFVYNPRISTSAPVGPINRNKLGRTGVMSPLYTVFRPHDIDTTYLEYFFKCGYWHSFMNFNGDSGARSDRFSIRDNVFFQMPIPIPDIDEQRKIGELLTCLDNLITLHQRKFEKLTNVKKSMLEKMFPQNGSSYPEIRFKGFTDPWEQRKLGDMMNVTSVKRIHQSDWTDSGVRFLRARDIVAAAKNEEPDDYLYISKEKYEEYSTLSGKVGVSDLLVTGVGTIGVPYLVRNLEPLYFKDGNIIWFQNSDKIDGKFLFYSFSAEQIQGFINESAGIGTVGTYTIESGKKTPISLPNQIEQAKVGEFFQQLDNLITLHQRELEKLQNIKKSMLEKMFV